MTMSIGLVSIIEREYVLSRAFKSYFVHEVYAEVGYTIGLDNPNLVILQSKNDGRRELFEYVNRVYPNIGSCSITCNPKHPALAGKKIIYRDGVWYV